MILKNSGLPNFNIEFFSGVVCFASKFTHPARTVFNLKSHKIIRSVNRLRSSKTVVAECSLIFSLSNNVLLQNATVLTAALRLFYWKLNCIFKNFYCTCNSSQGPLDLLIAVWSLLIVHVWICSFLFRLIFQKKIESFCLKEFLKVNAELIRREWYMFLCLEFEFISRIYWNMVNLKRTPFWKE